MTRLFKPVETYTISGAAFDSGNHGGIERVEVSIDDGMTTSVDDVSTWEAADIWGERFTTSMVSLEISVEGA